MAIDRHLDPELAPVFEAFGLTARPLFDLTDVAGARGVMAALAEASRAAAGVNDAVEVFERAVPGIDGDPDITLRITRPIGQDEGAPALLWFHGGGMLLGTAAGDDPLAAGFAQALGCAVICPDYRLAPEHRFPAPVNDGLAAYRWLLDHGAEIGIAPDRIALGGFSAGGGLAVGVTLMIRDRGLPLPLFLSLTAPMLDDRGETASVQESQWMSVWDKTANDLAWAAYLGPDCTTVSPYAAPARAEGLAGLPATFIAIGEIDLFRDEALDFARRLVAAGVPTEFHLYPGACHGFDGLNPDAAIVRAFTAARLGYLARMFRR